MTKNLKKALSILLAIVMVVSTFAVGITANANESISLIDSAQDIDLDSTQTVQLNPGEVVCYRFTPEEDDIYMFRSTDLKGDAVSAVLYSEDSTPLTFDNIYGKYSHFVIAYPMVAGETYYLVAGYYDETVSGDVTISLEYSPVVSIEVRPIILNEGIRGDFYYDWDETIGDYDYSKPYYRYEWQNEVFYTVRYRNGSVSNRGRVGSFSLYGITGYNCPDVYFETYDTQSYSTQWQPGKHPVTLMVMGFTFNLEVEILASKSNNGWIHKYGNWGYYVNGQRLTNQWIQDTQGWCYVDSNGFLVTNNWVRDSVGWCYVDYNGRCVTNKWIIDSKGVCAVDGQGHLMTNTWLEDQYGWRYLGSDGYMITNSWLMDSAGWCYVGDDGYCVTDSWMKDSIGWCYLGSDGRMVTNTWVKDSVGWCYIGADGYMVYDRWVKDSNGWCYIGTDGYWKP